MNTLQWTGRLTGALALAVTLEAPAHAQCPGGGVETQTFVASFGPELGSWPLQQISVPKWEPPCPTAQLIRVQMQLCATTEASVDYINNDDNVACDITLEVTLDAFATPEDAAFPTPDACVPDPGVCSPDLNVNLLLQGGPINVPPMTSGSTDLGPVTECNFTTFTSPASVAFFISEPGDTEVVFDHQGDSDSNHDGCGVVEFVSDIFTELELTVTYTYCNCDAPPEGCVCLEESPHYRRPGSLLLFPEFDNLEGDITILTVTNTDCSINSEDIQVHYRYIDREDCQEFDRQEPFTPCDTLTLLTGLHNPGQEQGFVYAYAVDLEGVPIVHNHLIGNLLVISGISLFDYSINPVVFRAPGLPGSETDADNDGIRDLDDTEYEPAPDTITLPRFMGQSPGVPGLYQSQLILLALSGGQQFTETRIDCILYNDNEQPFSLDYTFFCWDKPFLAQISQAFTNQFLKTTDHDPLEIVGAPSREAGWLCCDGGVASSTQETIVDPAFYMVLVERVGNFALADLPFECGVQFNGALIPDDLLGDGDPIPMNDDNQ
jgi:hypothetical protein